MHSNQKLTKVIAGRTINATSNAADALYIVFNDGSEMKVKTPPGNSTNRARTGGKVLKARQEGTTLALDFEDGGTLEIPLAEATSSVMLRSKGGTMEYAD